jgi:hypothetical protein
MLATANGGDVELWFITAPSSGAVGVTNVLHAATLLNTSLTNLHTYNFTFEAGLSGYAA